VSSVASVLTVSVSKAWSNNISALSGEGSLNHSVENEDIPDPGSQKHPQDKSLV